MVKGTQAGRGIRYTVNSRLTGLVYVVYRALAKPLGSSRGGALTSWVAPAAGRKPIVVLGSSTRLGSVDYVLRCVLRKGILV